MADHLMDSPKNQQPTPDAAILAINRFCPRSHKPVRPDSFTRYRGLMVGFCNPGCRDDFATHWRDRPDDTRYFDVLIQEHQLDCPDVDGADVEGADRLPGVNA